MIEYVVRPGDSLYTIASRYGVPVQLLAQINGLSNTDIVYVGQALQIPVGGGGAYPTPQPTPPFPGSYPGSYGLEQRVSLLEQQVRQLQREVAQLTGGYIPFG